MYGANQVSCLSFQRPDRSPYVQGVKGEAEVEPPLLLGPQQRRGLQIQHLIRHSPPACRSRLANPPLSR